LSYVVNSGTEESKLDLPSFSAEFGSVRIGVLNAKHQVDWQMLIGSGSLRVSANRIPSAPAAQVDFLVHQFRQRPIREEVSTEQRRQVTRAHARGAALVDRTVDHGEHIRGDARDGARSPIGRRGGSKRRTSPRGGSRFA
jgi:hypothetical protein